MVVIAALLIVHLLGGAAVPAPARRPAGPALLAPVYPAEDSRPVTALRGVGPVLAGHLAHLGIRTLADLLDTPPGTTRTAAGAISWPRRRAGNGPTCWCRSSPGSGSAGAGPACSRPWSRTSRGGRRCCASGGPSCPGSSAGPALLGVRPLPGPARRALLQRLRAGGLRPAGGEPDRGPHPPGLPADRGGEPAGDAPAGGPGPGGGGRAGGGDSRGPARPARPSRRAGKPCAGCISRSRKRSRRPPAAPWPTPSCSTTSCAWSARGGPGRPSSAGASGGTGACRPGCWPACPSG